MTIDERLARDPALTGDLTATIERLLPALEAFTRFDGPDPAVARSRWKPLLDEPLPDRGAGAEAVLDILERVVIPNGLRLGHPGFTGWVTAMPTTIATAAGLAQSVASPQRWWAHAGNFIDTLAAAWLGDLLGLPPTFRGWFTSGGSVANLVGIGAARQHAAENRGLDPSRDGLAGLPEPRVYASSEAHDVITRAAGVLGIGRANVRVFRYGPGRRPDLDELRRLIDEDVAAGRTPVAVVASAGDVNSGVVEPIGEMTEIAHERGVWLHVDGAYGAFGVLDDRVRELYGDLGAVDSLAVDPHKWLAAPVGTGAAFVRDEGLMRRAFMVGFGDYAILPPPVEGDPGSIFDEHGDGSPDYGVEFSAPARGIPVWAILKEIGRDGMRARVARDLDCARRVAELVRASDELELLAEPVLSICCYRYRPPGVSDEAALDELNEALVMGLRAGGRVIPSSTRIDGRYAIRPCFINPRSTLADADALVAETLALGRSLAGGRA